MEKDKEEIPKMDAYILGKDRVKVFLRTKVYTKREGEGGYIFMTVPELLASVETAMRALQHREHHKIKGR